MHKMIRISAALAMGLSLSFSAMAMTDTGSQPANTTASKSHEARPTDSAPLMRMKEKLNLSDEQVAKIQEIMDHSRAEAEKIRGEFKALEDKLRSEFKSVLSDEQFQQWEEMRKERLEKHQSETKR